MKQEKPPLLFDWPERHHLHLFFPLALAFAAALHFASFFLFQISYPAVQARPLRTAEAYFLSPQSPAAAKLAPLIGASDPALFSPSQSSGRPNWDLSEAGYTASFDETKPQFAEWPETAGDEARPQFWKPQPVNAGAGARPEAKSAPGANTVIRLGGELAERSFESSSSPVYHALPKQSLKPVQFLVAVSPEGRALHVFRLIQSSGNEQLDKTASQALLQGKFSPGPGNSPAWGTVTFHWGADVRRVSSP